MEDKKPRNERWIAFERIWAKGMNGKMRMRLMAKCIQRGLEPTEDNCRDYWMGYIRYYKGFVDRAGLSLESQKE